MGKGQLAGIPNWLKRKLDLFKTVTIPLLKSDWVLDEETETYRQSITVKGITDKSSPTVGLSSVSDVATRNEIESFLCITDIVTSKDTITFIANKLPTISFTVVAKGIVASDNDVAADITALVGRVSELEQGMIKYHIDSGVGVQLDGATYGIKLKMPSEINLLENVVGIILSYSNTVTGENYGSISMGAWEKFTTDTLTIVSDNPAIVGLTITARILYATHPIKEV